MASDLSEQYFYAVYMKIVLKKLSVRIICWCLKNQSRQEKSEFKNESASDFISRSQSVRNSEYSLSDSVAECIWIGKYLEDQEKLTKV